MFHSMGGLCNVSSGLDVEAAHGGVWRMLFANQYLADDDGALVMGADCVFPATGRLEGREVLVEAAVLGGRRLKFSLN
jgi:hypothetical protein